MTFHGLLDTFHTFGKTISTAKILICGLAFKGNPETGDVRNSSGVDVALRLREVCGQIYGYDPVALREDIEDAEIVPVQLPDAFEGMDAILFLNNHKSFERLNVFEMTRSANEKPIILDGWNQFQAEEIISTRPCIYLGLSYKMSSV